jgi:hypothetical protein
MAIVCERIHLLQKQKHDQHTVNRQLRQLKITTLLILDDIVIVK